MKYYNLYKGLQRPLTFKLFKGKYIMWGAGFLIAAMVMGGLLAGIVNNVTGLIAFVAIGGIGIMFTLKKQETVGLHDKEIFVGTILITPVHRLKRNKNGKN